MLKTTTRKRRSLGDRATKLKRYQLPLRSHAFDGGAVTALNTRECLHTSGIRVVGRFLRRVTDRAPRALFWLPVEKQHCLTTAIHGEPEQSEPRSIIKKVANLRGRHNLWLTHSVYRLIMTVPGTCFRLIIAFLAIDASFASGIDTKIVERWLHSNAGTKSLKVDFVQSRSLMAIKKPIVQSGTLWLDYPTSQFRWQLGDPAKTIVVSHGEKIAVIRTPLKRVEYRDPSQSSGSSSGFSSLTKGFPKSLPEFQQRYRILDIIAKGNAYEIITRPLGRDSEGVKQFSFVIDQEKYLLKGLVIVLKDKSSITTTFKRVDRNPAIAPEIFQPDLKGFRETKFRQG